MPLSMSWSRTTDLEDYFRNVSSENSSSETDCTMPIDVKPACYCGHNVTISYELAAWCKHYKAPSLAIPVILLVVLL